MSGVGTKRLCLAALLVCLSWAGAAGREEGEAKGCGRMRTAGGEPVYGMNEVSERAAIRHRPEARYSGEAARHGVVGSVALRVVLGADGKVGEVVPVRQLPDGLTEQAARAARRIKFSPARKGGRAVAQCVVVEYMFRVSDQRLTEHVRVLGGPKPAYTDEARARGVKGKVVLLVEFTADGKSIVLDVVRGLPHGLTEAAEAAAREIKFTPARRGDRVLGEIRNVEYDFSP